MSKKSLYPKGVFLAQPLDKNGPDPWNSVESLCRHIAAQGATCVQLPSWDPDCINLDEAASSLSYCDDLHARYRGYGLSDGIAGSLATHLQGQLMAVHPALAPLVSAFCPDKRWSPSQMREWAVERLKVAIDAAANLGLKSLPTFSGSLLWPYVYQWPAWPPGFVKIAFRELAKIWAPVIRYAASRGVRLAFELHPGEDLVDIDSLGQFLDALDKVDPALRPWVGINLDHSHVVLQGADPVEHTRVAILENLIAAYHVKDAHAHTGNGRHGCYGGFLDWGSRSWQFLTPGIGYVDFQTIDELLLKAGIKVPRVLEWECARLPKSQGIEHGLKVILAVEAEEDLPEEPEPESPVEKFDKFAEGEVDEGEALRLLGLSPEVEAGDSD